MKREKVCLNRKVKTILKKVELKSDCLVPDIKPRRICKASKIAGYIEKRLLDSF